MRVNPKIAPGIPGIDTGCSSISAALSQGTVGTSCNLRSEAATENASGVKGQADQVINLLSLEIHVLCMHCPDCVLAQVPSYARVPLCMVSARRTGPADPNLNCPADHLRRTDATPAFACHSTKEYCIHSSTSHDRRRAQAWPLPAAIRGASPGSKSTLGKHASRDPRRGLLQETVNELRVIEGQVDNTK